MQDLSRQMNQTRELNISKLDGNKELFMTTYQNMPWKSYKMYNNVEKENNLLYRKIAGISAKQVQNQIVNTEQKHDLNQNTQLLVRVKKRQQDSARITEENRKMFLKLYTSKPYIDSQQQQQDYNQKKQIIKRLTRFPLQQSKMTNNQQPSIENIKTKQFQIQENKSFLLSDTKCKEIINEIDEEEIQGMRDSLRDGSYKLINFATKDNAIMASRPSSSLQRGSKKNIINTSQIQQKNIQQIQNLIKNHITQDSIPPRPVQIKKRAQSAMKTTRKTQQDEQLFFPKNAQVNYINLESSSNQQIKYPHTHRMRNDSIQQRKLSLPDQQQLQYLEGAEEEEQKQLDQISKQIDMQYLYQDISKEQNQLPKFGQYKGDSLNYSQSNIPSINYMQSIDQKNNTQPDQCTISINDILKNQLSQSTNPSTSATKYRSKQRQKNQGSITKTNDTIQVKDFFDDEVEGKNKFKYYYKNSHSNLDNFPICQRKSEKYEDSLDIQKQSQTQPIYQNEANYRVASSISKREKSYEDISKMNNYLNNQSLQYQGDEFRYCQEKTSNNSTIKTKKLNQINQQMMKIVQKNNNPQQFREQSPEQHQILNNDLQSSPTIQKKSRDTRFSYSMSKQLNSVEKNVRKSYQQNILNGQEDELQESFQFNYLNLNGLGFQQHSQRKQDPSSISFRKKNIVNQSLNGKPQDNSINFLRANKSQNRTDCTSLNYDEFTLQQIAGLPINKRATEIDEEIQQNNNNNAKLNQIINTNSDNKSTINNSKNPLAYQLPQLSTRREKIQK